MNTRVDNTRRVSNDPQERQAQPPAPPRPRMVSALAYVRSREPMAERADLMAAVDPPAAGRVPPPLAGLKFQSTAQVSATPPPPAAATPPEVKPLADTPAMQELARRERHANALLPLVDRTPALTPGQASMRENQLYATRMNDGVLDLNDPARLGPLTSEQQQAVDYFKNNPALLGPEVNGQRDMKLTTTEIEAIAGAARQNQADAKSAYDAFANKSPQPDATSRQFAQAAATLAAFDADLKARSNGNGYVNRSGLEAAAADPTLPDDVRQAAKLFASEGMFELIDGGGPRAIDGLSGKEDVVAFLQQAPASAGELATRLEQAAMQNIRSGVSTDGVGPDVFTDPGKYTVQQRTAVLAELQQASQRMAAGAATWGEFGTARYNLNFDPVNVMTELNGRIATLQGDPQVQQQIAARRGDELARIVDSHPALKAQVEAHVAQERSSGAGVAAALKATGPDGKPQSPGMALGRYGASLATLNDAIKGPPLSLPDIVKVSGQAPVLQQALDDVRSGARLTALLAADPSATSLAQYNSEAMALASGLGLDATALADLGTQVRGQIMDQGVLGQVEGKHLLGLVGTDGKVDEAKLTQYVQSAVDQDPALFNLPADATPQQRAAVVQQVATATRGAFDAALRQPTKALDSMSKAEVAEFLKTVRGNLSANPDMAAAYKAGAMHIGSSVVGGIAFVAGAIGRGGKFSPADIAGTVGSGMSLMGTFGEGYFKAAQTGATPPAGTPELDAHKAAAATAKLRENYSKLFGAAGNFLAAAGGIWAGVDAVKRGDTTGAALNFTSAGLAAGAGTLSAVEAVATLTGRAALAATAGALSGILGSVASAFTFVAVIVPTIVNRVTEERNQTTYFSGFGPTLSKYGITGGENPSSSMDWIGS